MIKPKIDFPVRQSREAFDYISRRHRLEQKQCVMLKQSSLAIDAGVFHNDVISFGTQDCLVLHEMAFDNQSESLDRISHDYQALFNNPLKVCVISDKQLPLKQVISSYFLILNLLQCLKIIFYLSAQNVVKIILLFKIVSLTLKIH